MTYNVTCNTDDNYAQHCCAMLCSLFENNKDVEFHVHILTHGLSVDNTEQIGRLCDRYNCRHTIYEVDESRLDGVKFRNYCPLTKAAYYRILLPDILNKDIEKILYLDCDIIVLENIKEIYEIELNNYALAACIDACPYNSHHRNQLGLSMTDYAFCSGVMMINLSYWREHQAVTKLLEFSRRDREPVYLHDQDSLNYVFKNKWLVLPPKWNRGVLSSFTSQPGEKDYDYLEYFLSPKILHYANHMVKPWFDVNFPERKHYIKYLSKSGYTPPNFIHRSFSQKVFVYKSSISYYANKYIRPFIPDIVEIIIKDIYDLISIIFFSIFNQCKFKQKILNKRIGKYNKGL